MEYRELGNSGLKVSRLCFGSLTVGPLQRALSPSEGASLIRSALEGGVNFIDTAEIYGTYPHIREALSGWKGEVRIATKTYAYTRDQAAKSLEKARVDMDRDVIDVFLLHEQESELTLQGHGPALDFLQEARHRGLIKAAGISSHTVAAVQAAIKNSSIQVIHPALNIRGLGITSGSLAGMIRSIEEAHIRGIGIYTMKPLGGGHLRGEAGKALSFVLEQDAVDSVAVGLGSEAEVEYALRFFSAREIPKEIMESLERQKRRLLYMPEDCRSCESCVDSCSHGALVWEGRPVVDESRCLYCGYCGAACPFLCLRII